MKLSTKMYYKNRYKEDPAFRKKHIERVRDWQSRNPEKIAQYRKNANERYRNRDKKEIARRRKYVKKNSVAMKMRKKLIAYIQRKIKTLERKRENHFKSASTTGMMVYDFRIEDHKLILKRIRRS